MKLKELNNEFLKNNEYTVIKLGAVKQVKLNPEDDTEIIDGKVYVKEKRTKYLLSFYKKGDEEVAFLERVKKC